MGCFHLSSAGGHRSACREWTLAHSLVGDVKDMLLASETAICDLELRLVERFRLIEAVTVRRSVLVSVHILLSFPGSAVPFLAVATVTSGERVRTLVHKQLGRVLKHN